MSDPAVCCVSLRKRYGSVPAVQDATLSLHRGGILALLGPSGCGKTTTLRLIAGLERPDTGRIEIGGRLVSGGSCFVAPEHRRVGMVFQDYALFPHMDVAANVGYGLPRDANRQRRVRQALALVGLDGVERRMPHELSGGQQQRVALARALAPQPDVVLLDEPFSNLDAGLRVRVRREVRQMLREAGASAVFVTHDQQEAFSLADDVALMLAGRVVQVAPPEELYGCPATREVAAFLGETDMISGVASGGVVVCELGTLPTCGGLRGAVEVMLRPEHVELAPQGPHLVLSREFYGHDQMLTVRLRSGETVRARMPSRPTASPHLRFAPGDHVRVRVLGQVTVFAPLGAGAEAAPTLPVAEPAVGS